MANIYISHQLIWLLVIITTYVTGGSCDSCNRKHTATPKSTPKPKSTATTPTPIDNADSASSTSSGYASDSSGAPSSGSSGSSNFSSGSASSSRSSSPAPWTDFAGLPNIGNTCYMNAALQIIAALYEDKVQDHDGLKKLVNKINNGHQPLTNKEMNEFVESLPEKAKEMARSGRQKDPHEFILHLENGLKLDPIGCYKRLIFRTKEIDKNKEVVSLRQQINSCKDKDCKVQCKHSEHQLFVDMDKEGTTQSSLSEMIELSREELMDNHPVERRSIGAFHQGSKSSFLEKNEKNLKFQCSESLNLKHYIQQQVIDKSKIPSILYLQLKRFTNENNKIETAVDGTFELTIKSDPNLDETIHFDLHGFILHKGSTSGGHYVAYVKRNGQWYEADDSFITKINQPTAIDKSKQAYLLFYKKK